MAIFVLYWYFPSSKPFMQRRPIASRSNAAILALARLLARHAVTPNQISVASIAASALVPAALFGLTGWAAALVAVLGIQLRLLANVIDGLVAVEGGKASPVGALYNEFPDRIADSLILVSLGYAAGAAWLGWLAALAAALTAYVRVFGGALGQPQVFCGPMAKQHRMAVASAALLAAPLAPSLAGWDATTVLQAGLVLIAAGSVLTCATRTRAIVRRLAATQVAL